MGPNYTVGADVGVWGISPGSYPLGLTPWVDKDLMAANKQLFVNTMSYHAPKDCGITPWQKDALDIHHLWGIAKRQINIGIGYYSFNLTGFEKIVGEPTWHVLGEHCPDVGEGVCKCDGLDFAGKRQNLDIAAFVRREGFRGVFPWAANYDAFTHNNSLIEYVGRGLGISE